MTREQTPEQGAAAVIVAGSLVFLFGMAALAVDTSDFYQTARVGQTTADLACLAGVAELPDQTAAIEMAMDYTEANWPEMASASRNVSSGTGTLSDGTGNVVTYQTDYDGPDTMHVVVTERNPTTFGRVLGTESVDVAQEAACQREVEPGSALPFGIDVGGFSGFLQKPNPCSGGNCNPLDIPRDDTNGTKEKLVKNSKPGPDRLLDWHRGNRNSPGSPSNSNSFHCEDVSAGDECHRVHTDTGVSASHLGEAVAARLEANGDTTCTWRSNLDCDTMSQVLGGTPESLFTAMGGTAPAGWDDGLYGPFTASNLSNHYYWNEEVAKCSAPRLGRAPIVAKNLDWDLGMAYESYSGKTELKIVGWLTVFIEAPTNTDDTFFGSGNLKELTASAIWFGPAHTCASTGEPLALTNGGSSSVKLVTP